MRRLKPIVAVVAAAAVLLPGGLPARAQAVPQASLRCDLLAFPTNERTSGELMCASLQIQAGPAGEESSRRIDIAASSDHGRTWTARAGRGLPALPSVWAPPPPSAGVGILGSSPVELFYSRGYATDHTVYLAVRAQGDGLFRSTDGGDTWTLAAALLPTQMGRFTPYVDDSSLPGVQVPLYPVAGTSELWMSPDPGDPRADGPVRIDPPAVRPEPGSHTDLDEAFTWDDDGYRGVQMLDTAWMPGSGSGTWDVFSKSVTTLRACTVDLDCATVLHRWPRGVLVGAPVLAADFRGTGRLFLNYGDERNPNTDTWTFGYLVSDDAGRHVRSWRWAEALRAAARRYGADASIEPVTNPDVGRRVVALVLTDCTGQSPHCQDGTPPAYRIFVSDDDGHHWRLTLASRGPARRGRYAGVPWPAGADLVPQLAPDGRLFMLSLSDDVQAGIRWDGWSVGALWCSTDSGRHWSSPCRR